MEEIIPKLLIAFVLTTISGFISGFIVRISGHHKWLIERRAEVFAQFLTMNSDARTTVTNLIYDKSFKEDIHRDIKITETNLPIENQANIVRLFLDPNLREEFGKLATEFRDLHSSYDLGQKRLVKMDKNLKRIQEIFENQLKLKYWLA